MCSKSLNKSAILKCLLTLNTDNPVDYNGDIAIICERNISASNYDDTQFYESSELEEMRRFNSEDSVLWKYIELNFDCLFKLGHTLNENNLDNVLSVKETKELKNVFRNVIGIGVTSNILQNLPYYSKLPSDDHAAQSVDVFCRYQRLIATVFGLYKCFNYRHLKAIILPHNLKWILIALYQIIHCPIKQPSDVPDINGFVMTRQIYETLNRNRFSFKTVFDYLSMHVHTVTYVRETMMLIGTKRSTNLWLKRAVSSTLTQIIRQPKGIEHLAWSMLDAAGIDDDDDTTKSWKIIDVIAKIVMESKRLPDFENICTQINNLLLVRNNKGGSIKPFERLFTLCTTLLFQQNPTFCHKFFIRTLLKPLEDFVETQHNFNDGENVLETVSQSVRILKSLVADTSVKTPLIETHVLDPIINVIFRIFTVTFGSLNFELLNNDIKVILLRFLSELDTDTKFTVFDSFLFDFENARYKRVRTDIEFTREENTLIIKCNNFSCGLRASHKADALISLMQDDDRTSTLLFAYLINCLCCTEKYFGENLSRRDLLEVEDEVVLDEVSDRKMIVYKLLSVLSENANIQNHVNQDPSLLIPYIKAVLSKNINNHAHKTSNFESESFQTLFLIVMLLQVLVENATSTTTNQYQVLLEPMQKIVEECNNNEMRSLLEDIILKLVEQTRSNFKRKINKTQVEKAFEDICDPLLPVRGHGLMALAKLIREKDAVALERKQFILNIFQQNLKNEDSFIYLSAIDGLASIADVFPNIIIQVLAEEYSEFSGNVYKDGHEVRMKVGEVLVRVVKGLGEMAPAYKALLLNTFLIGTKDDDSLVRASSLSNLGEICQVLGYKLGTIVSEVLVCVHAIITTDKAPEPRRAAVTVIKQLFVGLEKEMIVFFKDEILQLYRTLKNVYHNDADDVMRLQAQVALEQLNENMKEFVFPNLSLNFEKKIVIMN